MKPRQECDPVPEGWSYTEYLGHGRQHIYYRKGDLTLHIAFWPPQAANPAKWSVDEELRPPDIVFALDTD